MMKTRYFKLTLLLLFLLSVIGLGAQVNEYSFSSVLGTYTEITGGTVLGTNTNDNDSFNAIPLGFTFTYNGVDHTQVSIQTNAFIAFGSEVLSTNLPISSTTGTNNVVAALARDIKSKDNGELSYLLTGTEPNRVFIIQWKHYRRVPTNCANDDLNFQIQLRENGNKVVFAYGAFNVINVTTARTVQVGLRGNSEQDFNNRTTTTDWTATTPGTANNATCFLTDVVYPPNGLIFTFSPPQQGNPPEPAQNPNPPDNATNVPINTNLSWVSGGGIVDGYKIYFGTDNPPTNLVNGLIQTTTIYDHPEDLQYSTVYYWKIVPFNNLAGDALNCPVWQFTTLADPTIYNFPYNQHFDDVTPPALPIGWSTINANNDAYTWETYEGNAHTAPNAVRMRYNSTIPMDDWLITPPLNLTGGQIYIIRFQYRANSASFAEALSVYSGTAPDVANFTNLLFENNNINNIVYEQGEIVFSPPTTGNYYIGFHGHSPANTFYLYLDTFSIVINVDSMNPPTNLTAQVINNTYVYLSWNVPSNTVNRDLLGYKVYRDGVLLQTINDPAITFYNDLTVTVGTYSYTVTALYTAGESVPAGPVTATITPPAYPPTNLTATAQGFNVILNWQSPATTLVGSNKVDSTYRNRNLTGYKVYRDGTVITTITNPATTTYTDQNLNSGTYSYTVTAVYTYGESEPAGPVTVTIVPPPPTDLTATVQDNDVILNWISPQLPTETFNRTKGVLSDRALTGFKVYRNSALIGTITNPLTTTYTDLDVPNGTYTYGVTAVYPSDESAPVTVNVTVDYEEPQVVFEDGFEAYDNFVFDFSPWSLYDIDQSATYGITNITFPGAQNPMAFIIFNPSATTPPMTSVAPHNGAKMAASFSAVNPPNNDWMIAPKVHLGTESSFKFFAKSQTDAYGLERFQVGISTSPTIDLATFQIITPGNYVEAPTEWTEYSFDLSAYNNQEIWIGIHCVSNDAFIFYVDDVLIYSNGGYVVSNDDPTIPVVSTALHSNFPNPFNPETTIRFSVKETTPVNITIYNAKGQLVRTLVNNEIRTPGNYSILWDGKDKNGHLVSSGIYFCHMNAGAYHSNQKMVLMK
ncbi:MAG: choice-of-anchor J domain-containing protein [Candidatus Cloacimonadaceae bacterium]